MEISWIALAAICVAIGAVGFAIGWIICAVLSAGSNADDYSDAWADGYRAGCDTTARAMK